jgi:competence protein ComEA
MRSEIASSEQRVVSSELASNYSLFRYSLLHEKLSIICLLELNHGGVTMRVSSKLAVAALSLASLGLVALPVNGARAMPGPLSQDRSASVVVLAAEGPLDINTATKKQLSALPGIGDARSDAIIKGRPYKGKDELVQKNIIPDSVYQGIKDKIIAKQK